MLLRHYREVRLAEIRDLALSLGIPLRARRTRLTGRWNGNDLLTRGLSPDDFLHEIGHYLVASPERRSIPNYGLGSAETGLAQERSPVVVPKRTRYREESKAAVAAMLLGALMDHPFEKVIEDEADYDQVDSRKFAKLVREVAKIIQDPVSKSTLKYRQFRLAPTIVRRAQRYAHDKRLFRLMLYVDQKLTNRAAAEAVKEVVA